MKKSLIAGASVFALVAGFGSSAYADDINVAVGLNTLNSTVTNTATVEEDGGENQGIGGGGQESLNNNFGDNTYEDQVLNQNNIDSGINSAQQGGNAAAIAVDQDGVGFDIDPPEFDANLSIAGNIADQDVTNSATVNADDDNPDDDGEEFNGIAGDANNSLNNNFGSDTFDKQVINQNNINSGINSAQQGGNAAALSVDLDGSEDELSVNAAFSGNYLTQDAENDAIVSDAGNNGVNEDNDAIAGEVDDSLRNTFGTQTFENQVINQNNINAGINSAQQGANTTSIAASIGDPNIDLGPGDPDPETDDAISDAIDAIEDALAFDVGGGGIGNVGSDVEAFEGNVAAARSQGEQIVDNNAFNSGEGDGGEEDSGIGGDPERSLHNNFGDDTFRAQAINQNNINSGINSAQQGANTTALAVDTDGSFNILDVNIAVTDSNQSQDFTNNAEANDKENDGVGGFDTDGNPVPTDSLFNLFGDNTFKDQVINQNNINAGINSAQQGMNTTSMAIDDSGSIADINAAWASTTGYQVGDNTATDESETAVFDDTGLGIGGNPSDNNLNNVFGEYTFQDQAINQNNINAGINNAQQGGNTSALAVADNVSFVDLNLSVASTDLEQDVTNTASVNADDSGGVGGNAVSEGGNGPLSNHFGDYTFQNQVMNQNNINSGINSAQQGANTTALSLDLGGPGGVDLNGAVSLASLSQTVTNSASAMGTNNGGVGGGAVGALNNNFGNYTFQNQVMNQNNINSGINSAQQGSNTVAMAVSGGTFPGP